MRCFYFTNQLSQPVNLQGSYDFYVFKAQSNFLNLQSVKQLNIYRVLYIYFTSLFCKFMISNVRKPIFFWNPIHFHRKFWWITLFTALISCLTVLKREFFSNFLHLYDHSHSHFLICNEYAMIFSPESVIFLKNSDFFTTKHVSLDFFLCGQSQYAHTLNFFNCAWIFLIKHG